MPGRMSETKNGREKVLRAGSKRKLENARLLKAGRGAGQDFRDLYGKVAYKRRLASSGITKKEDRERGGDQLGKPTSSEGKRKPKTNARDREVTMDGRKDCGRERITDM